MDGACVELGVAGLGEERGGAVAEAEAEVEEEEEEEEEAGEDEDEGRTLAPSLWTLARCESCWQWARTSASVENLSTHTRHSY